MKLRPMIFKAAALCFLTFLVGCLVSDDPLLDHLSGQAMPLVPGIHKVCPRRPGGTDQDCGKMDVTLNAQQLYRFWLYESPDGKEDDLYTARFRRIGRGWYLMEARDGHQYRYFYATKVEEGLAMWMMSCPELRAVVRDKYLKLGEMEIEYGVALEDGERPPQTCHVKSRDAAIAAAKSYAAKGLASAKEYVLLTRLKESQSTGY